MGLLKPHHIESNLDMWVDERIWGHRFHNEQTPWLILLEFFAVFQARDLEGCALLEKRENGKHEKVRYSIPKQEPLRFLIFNNPSLRNIENNVDGNDERWRRWKHSVRNKRVSQNFDYDYLKTRFGDFSNFAQIVELFQSTSLEQERNRRWTSKFIFPYGPDCVYADVREERGALGGSDRRFYARGGELLYLMFNRSENAGKLAAKIKKKLLRPDELWNCLGSNLIPEGYSERTQNMGLGYLPYEWRKEYEDISEDWLKLLSMKIPGTAVLDPLMRLTALHLLLYIMRRSLEVIDDGEELFIVLEIAAPQKTALFDLSADNYKANRTLSRRALETHLVSIKDTAAWRKACAQKAPEQATLELLKEQFHWQPKDKNGISSGNPDHILKKLLEAAHRRHKQHFALVLTDWSRRIGLSVARRHTGTWYSPDDAFLKALVMANVDEREEYNRFLAKLYDRYHLVVGVAEAEKAYGRLPTDERVLAENTSRLEQRLRTLGLLRRLSDDCAYVVNNFGDSQ